MMTPGDGDFRRAALLLLHFQADVFSLLPDDVAGQLLAAANALIESWRAIRRPVIFANCALGPRYESASKNNKLVLAAANTGLFRNPIPAPGLRIDDNDIVYDCPRGSVFVGTSLHADLQSDDIDTLVMAGISSSGVLFSSLAWASDADYRIWLVKSCSYDPDAGAHEALFRSAFASRATIVEQSASGLDAHNAGSFSSSIRVISS